MKNLISISFLIFTLQGMAQDFNETLVVPLSNPNAPGKLEIGLVRGDISIESYDGDEVMIEATAKGNDRGRDRDRDRDCDDCKEKSGNNIPSGMKRISSSAVELSAEERNNLVEIETNSWKKSINLNIKLPSDFDLDVSTVHGKISVSGINGAMEVSAVHGPLTFSNVSGSIICNTVHGAVTANFQKVTSDEPMSFVTLHGDVDITFPSSVKATAKMKSDRGEIYTDFEMTVDKSRPEVKSTDSGNYKVSINSWVFGDINGGGPEFTFKNMHGDIIIRKD